MRKVALFMGGAIAGAVAFSVLIGMLRGQDGGAAMKDDGARATNTGGPKVSISQSGYDVRPLSKERIEELAKRLAPEEREVILAKGTERAFCGNLLDNKMDGVYVCRLCGLPLFGSDAKFNSGTGWPSFSQPFDRAHVHEERDESHGMVRVEITCARCGGHLGHVFDDGPRPTGLRYCLNSASLEFVKKGVAMPERSRPVAGGAAAGAAAGAASAAGGKMQTAYFAGGCFWGVEDRFAQVPGVIDAVSGYMGGRTEKPTYEAVCGHGTGHAETVKVVFDPAKVSYKELLAKFFKFHDPTQMNRQGPDIGDQYRSAIFAADKEQAEQARAFIEEQGKSERFKGRKIATQVVGPDAGGKVPTFHAAEEYHQDYHMKHGGHCPVPQDD